MHKLKLFLYHSRGLQPVTRHAFPVTIFIALLLLTITFSYAQVTYAYDELNRLKQAQNSDGTAMQYAYDSAGNRRQVESSDIVPPVTTASPAAETYATVLSVTLTCNDGTGSGCDMIYYTTDGTKPTKSSPIYSLPIRIVETTTIKYFATDHVGNGETVKTATYTIKIIDNTPPTGTIAINGGAAYTNSTSVKLTLSCVDAGGCSQMKFSNNNTAYSSAVAYATLKTWTLTTGAGTKTVYVKFKDVAGNWSSVYNSTIVIDTTKPETTATPEAGAFTGAQSITLSCIDDAGSGCDKIYYTTNGTTPTTSSAVYSTAINIPVTTSIKFFAKDRAGNSEDVKTKTYKIR